MRRGEARALHPGRGAPRASGEEGSILPLTIAFGVLAILLVLVVAAATSLYLEHKRLLSLADGASLAAAEAFPLEAVHVEEGRARAVLRPEDVARAAADYVRDVPGKGLDDLRIVRATSPDGRSATVELAATWHPPVVTFVVPGGVPLAATSTARAVFR